MMSVCLTWLHVQLYNFIIYKNFGTSTLGVQTESLVKCFSNVLTILILKHPETMFFLFYHGFIYCTLTL